MLKGRAFAQRLVLSAAHPTLCQDASSSRATERDKPRGVILVTKGANPEVQALLLRLHSQTVMSLCL